MEDVPRGKILVVDDDRPFCLALTGSLRRRGYQCLLAHDLREAREEITAWSPSHVCVDLRLNEESGLDLVRHLNETDPSVIVVVLTGYGSIATAVEATKLGATQYLTKPVSADDVLRALAGKPKGEMAVEAAPLQLVEWEHLQRVLFECEGNVSEAARRLGMHRRTLQRKLARGRAQGE